jgi:hypothetical protein
MSRTFYRQMSLAIWSEYYKERINFRVLKAASYLLYKQAVKWGSSVILSQYAKLANKGLS